MVAFAVGVTKILAAKGIVPEIAAGLSLGEYSALYAAGVFEEQQVINLFKRRLPRQHPPPDLRPQIAEGMSLFSVDAVQHQGDALVFQ